MLKAFASTFKAFELGCGRGLALLHDVWLVCWVSAWLACSCLAAGNGNSSLFSLFGLVCLSNQLLTLAAAYD